MTRYVEHTHQESETVRYQVWFDDYFDYAGYVADCVEGGCDGVEIERQFASDELSAYCIQRQTKCGHCDAWHNDDSMEGFISGVVDSDAESAFKGMYPSYFSNIA